MRDLSLTYARDKKASIDGAKALFDGEGMNDTKPCKGADGAASPVLVKSRRDSSQKHHVLILREPNSQKQKVRSITMTEPSIMWSILRFDPPEHVVSMWVEGRLSRNEIFLPLRIAENPRFSTEMPGPCEPHPSTILTIPWLLGYQTTALLSHRCE